MNISFIKGVSAVSLPKNTDNTQKIRQQGLREDTFVRSTSDVSLPQKEEQNITPEKVTEELKKITAYHAKKYYAVI